MLESSADQGVSGDGLLRAAPSAVGVDSRAVEAMLDDIAAAGLELHSLMLHRRERVAVEAFWWPYAPGQRRIMHSFAKSVMAAAIGLAIADGHFALRDKVVSFFPDLLPSAVSDNLAAMTVEDLLTMRTGHAAEVGGSLWRTIHSSWIAEFFKIPVVTPPGTNFVYSSAASYMLAAILYRTTGQTLHQYLKPRLFEPLGITGETWDIGPDGFNAGGNGLSCKTVDMLKIGVLHQQKGVWNGRRLLPESWIAEATRTHAQGGPEDYGDYGYQWWTYPDEAFAGIGIFVQMVLVLPRYGATLAVTGAMEGSAVLIPILERHFPALFRDAPFDGAAADAHLAERIAATHAPRVLTSTASPFHGEISGVTYEVEGNTLGVAEMRLDFSDDRCTYTMVDAEGPHVIVAGRDQWIAGRCDMPGQELHHGYRLKDVDVLAGARWADADTLEITWIYTGNAFRDTVTIRFDGDRVTVDRRVNINSAARKLPTLTGLARG